MFQLSVDPRTGQALAAAAKVGLLSRLFDYDDDTAKHARLAELPMSLSGAVVAAELAAGGMAVKADFSTEGGIPSYEIEVAGQEGIRQVVIDATNGRVLRTTDLTSD